MRSKQWTFFSEVRVMLLAPVIVVAGWFNDNLLSAWLNAPSAAFPSSLRWLPLFERGEKWLIFGLCAAILVGTKPYEANLYTRPQDVRVWKWWKNIFGWVAGLTVFECGARSGRWFGWMGETGRAAFQSGMDASMWAWMPLYIWVFSLVFFGATKRCIVFLNRMMK